MNHSWRESKQALGSRAKVTNKRAVTLQKQTLKIWLYLAIRIRPAPVPQKSLEDGHHTLCQRKKNTCAMGSHTDKGYRFESLKKWKPEKDETWEPEGQQETENRLKVLQPSDDSFSTARGRMSHGSQCSNMPIWTVIVIISPWVTVRWWGTKVTHTHTSASWLD